MPSFQDYNANNGGIGYRPHCWVCRDYINIWEYRQVGSGFQHTFQCQTCTRVDKKIVTVSELNNHPRHKIDFHFVNIPAPQIPDALIQTKLLICPVCRRSPHLTSVTFGMRGRLDVYEYDLVLTCHNIDFTVSFSLNPADHLEAIARNITPAIYDYIRTYSRLDNPYLPIEVSIGMVPESSRHYLSDQRGTISNPLQEYEPELLDLVEQESSPNDSYLDKLIGAHKPVKPKPSLKERLEIKSFKRKIKILPEK